MQRHHDSTSPPATTLHVQRLRSGDHTKPHFRFSPSPSIRPPHSAVREYSPPHQKSPPRPFPFLAKHASHSIRLYKPHYTHARTPEPTAHSHCINPVGQSLSPLPTPFPLRSVSTSHPVAKTQITNHKPQIHLIQIPIQHQDFVQDMRSIQPKLPRLRLFGLASRLCVH
jgi:hypothetical protein